MDGAMSPRARYDAGRLLEQLRQFVTEVFHISLLDACEDPHVLRFVDHCLERPVVYGRSCIQRPIRKNLVWRIRDLAALMAEEHVQPPLGRISFEYAREAMRRYSTADHGSIAATPADVIALAEQLNERNPWELRLKTCILLLWATWARPTELLRRYYPDDISAKYRKGVVLAVPRSKTNTGPAEYIPVEHDPNSKYCAVCVLRRWLDWLGDGYHGPLFPRLEETYPHHPRSTPISPISFRGQLRTALRRHALRTSITPYSFRKGAATTAAANGWDFEEIQRRLRHRSFSYSLSYIDRRVLTRLMKVTVD